MWEEINKKQNEDKMLELQYYARKQYNKSVILSEINIAVILISIILEILNVKLMMKWLLLAVKELKRLL